MTNFNQLSSLDYFGFEKVQQFLGWKKEEIEKLKYDKCVLRKEVTAMTNLLTSYTSLMSAKEIDTIENSGVLDSANLNIAYRKKKTWSESRKKWITLYLVKFTYK